MTAGPDNKGVVLVTKNTKRETTISRFLVLLSLPLLVPDCLLLGSRKPREMFVKVQLQKDRRKTYKTIRRSLGCAGYRPDLLEVGVADRGALDVSFSSCLLLKGLVSECPMMTVRH